MTVSVIPIVKSSPCEMGTFRIAFLQTIVCRSGREMETSLVGYQRSPSFHSARQHGCIEALLESFEGVQGYRLPLREEFDSSLGAWTAVSVMARTHPLLQSSSQGRRKLDLIHYPMGTPVTWIGNSPIALE